MNPAFESRNLAALVMALAFANGAAAQSVTMRDLGTLGGSASNAISVNDSQQVAGVSSIAGDAAGHAFVWTAANGLVDLGTLGGTWSRLAYRPDDPGATMNRRGEVTGYSALPGDGSYHAFLWSAETGMVDLGTLGGAVSQAEGVSDTGQVVGTSYTPSGAFHAFSWTAQSGMLDVGTLPGDQYSVAIAVNNHGQIVGRSFGAAGWRAFSWTAEGGMIDLGFGAPPTGPTLTEAVDVNDSGQVAGWGVASDGSTQAFLWSADAGMVILGPFLPVDLNAHGQVAGNGAGVDGSGHAFSWTAAGGLVDIGPAIANAVSDRGDVVGEGQFVTGEGTVRRAFLWNAAGGLVNLGTAFGEDSMAVAVNNGRQVVGWSGTEGTTAIRATMWVLSGDIAAEVHSVIDRLRTYGLPHGLTNALGVKLTAAIASWSRGRSGAAFNQLRAFVNEVNAQRGKKLTKAQADELLTAVQQIMSELVNGTGQ
jgi:probable HAF family extracellular repeat protein